MQSGPESPRSSEPDPDTATASDPGSPTVPTSGHPPAVTVLALGLTMDDNDGEGPVIGGRVGRLDPQLSTANSHQSSETASFDFRRVFDANFGHMLDATNSTPQEPKH